MNPAHHRDARLYRAEHDTFEAYCRDRWGMERRHAYRLIEASEVVGNVSNWAQTLPATESQARELVPLKQPDAPACEAEDMTDEERKERERIYQEVGYKLQQIWNALPRDAKTAARDPITDLTVALRRTLTPLTPYTDTVY